jgi:hypothetical protein
LEAYYRPDEGVADRAMTEAIERVDYAAVDSLYEAFERLGLEGKIDAAVLHPLLTEDEAAALHRLVERHDEVLKEWQCGEH